MRIRIKFGKEGAMKFIGHLDIMRYFQKAIKRSGLDICYTEGFSPHMVMSFASPLGVGVTSSGEYFDIEVKEPCPSAEAVRRLNEVMAEGVKVYSYRKIAEGKKNNAMALITAADYQVRFRDGQAITGQWQEKFHEYMDQESILLVKKTKKSETEIDIRPFIYEYQVNGEEIFLKLSAGSVTNIKPDLVMAGFAAYLGLELAPFALIIHRLEMYSGTEEFIPLEMLGEEIE